ncbi:MAG TPA: EAL domain-containing protein [Herbaspirillum sp.]|jgi:diguanylate cyclase (GGDEF)-like protein/PAS domain S-box-containing protein|nr:EAL domain-containing protein [Herbaspirillum sp.]
MQYISGQFFYNSIAGPYIYGIFDPWLVLLSILVAIFSSGMALQIAGMARSSISPWQRRAAIATGSIALGGGIWAMHFIGMLAFQLCAQVSYAPVATIMSMLPALGASWVALSILTRSHITQPQLIAGGLLVGAGIGVMHYSGMSAMQMTLILRYNPWLFALSIVVAVALAMLALWIRYGLRVWGRGSAVWSIVISGVVMGLAISGMHYTGMLAARFIGSPTSTIAQPPIGATYLAPVIACITVILTILVVAMNSAIRYRQLFYEMKFNESRLQAIFDTAVDGIVTIDSDGVVQSMNRSAESLFGWHSDEIVGKNISLLMPELDSSRSNARQQGGAQIGFGRMLDVGQEVTGRHRDGTSMQVRFAIGKVIESKQSLFVGIISDISERKRAEERVNFAAFHDALTELPNRLLLRDRFEQAIEHANREKSKVGLIFCDLDNFKTVNDSLGHAIGDMLIKHVAKRLTECVRTTDTVSRHGGDEFLVILDNLPDADTAAPILAKIMTHLTRAYNIEGMELHTSASIGIAIYPDDGDDFDTIMKKADMAMYRAKDAGRNTYCFFDAQMNVDVVALLRMRSDLRRALECNEFVLHFQPQINLETRELSGVEALVRWNHPEFGLIYPDRFIQVAEDSGLIIQIGEWILREACRQAVEWHQAGMKNLVMAVNFSAVQFMRGDLVQLISEVLRESGIAPVLLELELTESILIADTENILATVMRLKQLGIKLSIDDFGTGYSSLSYLKRFEVDKLKIDKSFVRDMASDADDVAIVRAVIQMAKSLGLVTIAEGVEDAHTARMIKNLGCMEAQGYYFSRPMPAIDFPAYCRSLPCRFDTLIHIA